MITGLHILTASTDPAADRAFLRDVLGWSFVEDTGSGPGWLIFKTPVAELGVHPAAESSGAELYLMCDDLDATIAELAGKGVVTGPVRDARFGRLTSIPLPSGASLGLYQPSHALAITLGG
ncbi:VOC family protein [Xylanimonas sp. McL0601]|uniref:VOC family protein n=1 Tax=Xylanimonas sp. McL0601 TaxID=3414739 RepID=UPI003CFA6B98